MIPELGLVELIQLKGPPFAGKESAYFLCVNRNKRSMTLNLKSKQGVEIIKKLVKESDVLVENYVPGKLDQLGLGWKTVKEWNPRLIYASITGYGSGSEAPMINVRWAVCKETGLRCDHRRGSWAHAYYWSS